MDQSLEPIVVPHLDRVKGLAEAQGLMRNYTQGACVADDHRGWMSTKQTRSDYENDFEHGVGDCLAFEQRAELLREHHRLCPYRLIPEESRDPRGKVVA